jgi:hypothetical protein
MIFTICIAILLLIFLFRCYLEELDYKRQKSAEPTEPKPDSYRISARQGLFGDPESATDLCEKLQRCLLEGKLSHVDYNYLKDLVIDETLPDSRKKNRVVVPRYESIIHPNGIKEGRVNLTDAEIDSLTLSEAAANNLKKMKVI